MNTRRKFLKKSALFTSLGSLASLSANAFSSDVFSARLNQPIVISTWAHGIPANLEAWKILSNGGKAIDAVEAGVKVPEADPNVRSVGYGGFPDQDGRVTLDACIMDENQQCGSVVCLEYIKHPISVARLVMDKTPHVMLAGEGALEFALSNGFEKENLVTPETLVEWELLKKASDKKKSLINIENHDTIGMLAMDNMGNLSGSCTTSGLALKMHGRVGDSPIIGAGLFVDNEVGAACATGHGEEVIKQAGSAMVVELMRNGASPEEACKEIVKRVMKKNHGENSIQVGFLALRKDGTYGAFSLVAGFNYAVHDAGGNRIIDSPYIS